MRRVDPTSFLFVFGSVYRTCAPLIVKRRTIETALMNQRLGSYANRMDLLVSVLAQSFYASATTRLLKLKNYTSVIEALFHRKLKILAFWKGRHQPSGQLRISTSSSWIYNHVSSHSCILQDLTLRSLLNSSSSLWSARYRKCSFCFEKLSWYLLISFEESPSIDLLGQLSSW